MGLVFPSYRQFSMIAITRFEELQRLKPPIPLAGVSVGIFKIVSRARRLRAFAGPGVSRFMVGKVLSSAAERFRSWRRGRTLPVGDQHGAGADSLSGRQGHTEAAYPGGPAASGVSTAGGRYPGRGSRAELRPQYPPKRNAVVRPMAAGQASRAGVPTAIGGKLGERSAVGTRPSHLRPGSRQERR